MHSKVRQKVAFKKLVVIYIWQKQSRDLGRKEGKRSTHETEIKAFIFYTLEKKERLGKIRNARRISMKYQFFLSNMVTNSKTLKLLIL